MNKAFLFLISICLFQPAFGQWISHPQLEYKRHANLNRVWHFVVEGKRFLWGITASGDVVKWDLQTEKVLGHPLQRLNRRATAIMLDRQGKLAVGFDDGSISVFDREKKELILLPAKGEGEIQFLLADAKNEYWAITPNGIFNVAGGTMYAPTASFFAANNECPRREWEAQSACLDDQGRLWVGFNYGEFGGDLHCFDTRKKIFVAYPFPAQEEETAQMGPSVQSIFCAEKESVLMTSGISHYGAGPSYLFRFDGSKWDMVFAWKSQKVDLYVGPGAYNPDTKKIYFYSERGFFRQIGVGQPIEGWELVVKSELDWKWGKNQIGPAMNVTQFAFIGGEDFVFSSDGNGVGICRNGKIRFLQQDCIQSDAIVKLLPGKKRMVIVGFDSWKEFFIPSWKHELYSILDDSGIKGFPLSEALKNDFERINGVAMMPEDQIVTLLIRSLPRKKTGCVGKKEFLFKYDGRRFVQLMNSSFPTHSDGVEQWIRGDGISGNRFLLQGADSVVEYTNGVPQTVFSGETRWVRYNNDGSILVCPESQPDNSRDFLESMLVLIYQGHAIELDLTPVNEMRRTMEAMLDSSYAYFDDDQWKRLERAIGAKLVYYKNAPLMVSGSEAYLFANGGWIRQYDIEEWLGENITFFDYIPELDVFLFQNDGSLFAQTQGKSFDLEKILDLECDVTSVRLWNNRVFLGTDSRGMIEFDCGELTKLIAPVPIRPAIE